jgi:uncharacterized protein YqgV (UPF0045/DUF77 family)
MIIQAGPASEEQAPSVARMIAAICDALREGESRKQAQPPAGTMVEQLELDARLQRIRTRLDWIAAQVGELEAELAVLKRIASHT